MRGTAVWTTLDNPVERKARIETVRELAKSIS
jgi:hypothetical protein